MNSPRFSQIVGALPEVVPFVAPETLERRAGRRLALRMGANESPYGPSPLAIEAMGLAARTGNLYNDPEGFELRTKIAEQEGVPLSHVVLGAGIDDLLMLVCRTFLDPGDPVVTSLGGYPTFNYAVDATGGTFVKTPYVDDRNDLGGLSGLAQKYRPKLVYLANPDNPSGSWYTPAEIVAFRHSLPQGTILLLDEAYADFALANPTFGLDDTGVIRLRTFSKAHGLAGLRVGYAVMPPAVAAATDKHRLHFGVNRVAQAGALASLDDVDHLDAVKAQTEYAKVRLAEIARKVGLEPLPSSTNFVCMATESRQRAEVILNGLALRDVFIRKPGVAPLDRCIRVTVAREPELELFECLLLDVVSGI